MSVRITAAAVVPDRAEHDEQEDRDLGPMRQRRQHHDEDEAQDG